VRPVGGEEADRQAYAAAYARPGRMRAGWAYFVSFLQAAKDFGELSRNRLTMPVLAIGGDKASGEFLGEQTKLVADDLRVVIIKNSGHWVIEEQPAQTTEALLRFLRGSRRFSRSLSAFIRQAA
jgi:pimeloyl-ACP methyl ester carboxylesterase